MHSFRTVRSEIISHFLESWICSHKHVASRAIVQRARRAEHSDWKMMLPSKTVSCLPICLCFEKSCAFRDEAQSPASSSSVPMETLQGAVETTPLTKAGQPAWRTTSIACHYNFATSARRDVQLTVILKCVVMLHAAASSRDDIVELPYEGRCRRPKTRVVWLSSILADASRRPESCCW